MDGLEQDRLLLRGLVDYARLAPAAVAREAGVAVTTVNRPYSGKATTRLSQPTLIKLRRRFPDYPGWASYFVGGGNDPDVELPEITITAQERELIELVRQIPEKDRAAIFHIARSIAASFPPPGDGDGQ